MSMFEKRIVYTAAILLSLATLGNASTYYVAKNGNDSNTVVQAQNPATPWQTIEKINSVMSTFISGDSILFKRGDVFRGQLNVTTSGLSFGAYGTGNFPVISGSIPVRDWTVYRDNIYVADIVDTVFNLFVNESQMTLCRYPNSGFLKIDTSYGNQELTCAALTQPSGYWNGSNVRIRTEDYAFETRKIVNSSPGSIFLDAPTHYKPNNGWGFYLDNNFEQLDTLKEWFYDPTGKKLFFIFPSGTDFSTACIEATVLKYGFYCSGNISNTTFRDLQIEHQAVCGIYADGALSNINIFSNRFQHQVEYAVFLKGSGGGSTYLIDKNMIQFLNGTGIQIENVDNGILSENVISNVGLVQGYGVSGVNNMSGIIVDASHTVISHNWIDSCGYNGIRCDGSNNIVEKNIIKDVMLRLNDGAGIYCYGTKAVSSVFKNNIVVNAIGNLDGTPHANNIACGIYIDNYASYITIQHNTVVDVGGFGIFLDFDSHHSTILDNVVYGSKRSQTTFYDSDEHPGQNLGNITKRNVFYSLSIDASVLLFQTDFNNFSPGIFDSNYYCNPYSYYILQSVSKTGQSSATKIYTLERWQTLSGQDTNSKVSFVNYSPYKVVDVTGGDMIVNGNFINDIHGWHAIPIGNSSIMHVTNQDLDDGCLKYHVSYTDTIKAGFTYTMGFGLQSDQFYQINFSVVAPMNGNLIIQAYQAHSPFNNLGLSRLFPIGSVRRDYVMVFKPKNGDISARLDFGVQYPDSIYYLDNVKLLPVRVIEEDPQTYSKIFVNETDTIRAFSLENIEYRNLDGSQMSNSIIVDRFSSRILVRPAPQPFDPNHPKFELNQNYPNPFNGGTKILFFLPRASDTVLKIYNLLGQLITTLVNDNKEAGVHQVNFDPGTLSSGVYFYRLQAGNFTDTRKMLLLK